MPSYLDADLVITKPELVKAEEIEGTFYGISTLNSTTIGVGISQEFNNSSSPLTVASGDYGILTVDLTRQDTQAYKAFIPVPQYDIYVNTDNDEDYLFPYGSQFTTGSPPPLFLPIITCFTTITGSDVSGGTFRYTFTFANFDSGSHDYYVHLRLINAPTNPSNSA